MNYHIFTYTCTSVEKPSIFTLKIYWHVSRIIFLFRKWYRINLSESWHWMTRHKWAMQTAIQFWISYRFNFISIWHGNPLVFYTPHKIIFIAKIGRFKIDGLHFKVNIATDNFRMETMFDIHIFIEKYRVYHSNTKITNNILKKFCTNTTYSREMLIQQGKWLKCITFRWRINTNQKYGVSSSALFGCLSWAVLSYPVIPLLFK